MHTSTFLTPIHVAGRSQTVTYSAPFTFPWLEISTGNDSSGVSFTAGKHGEYIAYKPCLVYCHDSSSQCRSQGLLVCCSACLVCWHVIHDASVVAIVHWVTILQSCMMQPVAVVVLLPELVSMHVMGPLTQFILAAGLHHHLELPLSMSRSKAAQSSATWDASHAKLHHNVAHDVLVMHVACDW